MDKDIDDAKIVDLVHVVVAILVVAPVHLRVHNVILEGDWKDVCEVVLWLHDQPTSKVIGELH